MRWARGVGLAGGFLAAAALGGCGHGQSEEQASVNWNASQQMSSNQSMSTERQPVAGHDTGNLKLTPQGKYSVPQGNYQVPEGEYFAPKGIYGERGKLIGEGKIYSQGEYGTYTRPEGTIRQPEGIKTQPEGTFFKAFGSTEVSNQRQPVAGHDTQPSTLFIRDDQGRTWEIRDPAIVRRVEQRLSDQGCNPGRTDGVADQQFGKAVMQCQEKLGVQQTGVIDQGTARALGLDWSQLKTRHEQQKYQQQQP